MVSRIFFAPLAFQDLKCNASIDRLFRKTGFEKCCHRGHFRRHRRSMSRHADARLWRRQRWTFLGLLLALGPRRSCTFPCAAVVPLVSPQDRFGQTRKNFARRGQVRFTTTSRPWMITASTDLAAHSLCSGPEVAQPKVTAISITLRSGDRPRAYSARCAWGSRCPR